MTMQAVKYCINELNNSSYYSKHLEKLPLGRFNLITSLFSVVKYENVFYKTQGEYTQKKANHISDYLRDKVRCVTLLKNRYGIDCWDINPFDSEKYIIFFSGIGSEKSDLALQFAYEKFVENGWGVFAFDYSGRGLSKGEFSQKNALKDSRCVYEYLLKKNIAPYNIGFLGHSLGAGVALDFSTKVQPSFLLLLNPFNNACDMVRTIAGELFVPAFVKETVNNLPDILLPLKNRFNNERALRNIEVPTLILHDKCDEIIPIRLSRKLYFKNKNKKNISFVELDNNNHEIYPHKIDLCLEFIEKSQIWFFNDFS